MIRKLKEKRRHFSLLGLSAWTHAKLSLFYIELFIYPVLVELLAVRHASRSGSSIESFR
jgi:hypothetical protein